MLQFSFTFEWSLLQLLISFDQNIPNQYSPAIQSKQISTMDALAYLATMIFFSFQASVNKIEYYAAFNQPPNELSIWTMQTNLAGCFALKCEHCTGLFFFCFEKTKCFAIVIETNVKWFDSGREMVDITISYH